MNNILQFKVLHSNATSTVQIYTSNADIYSGSQNILAFDENNKKIIVTFLMPVIEKRMPQTRLFSLTFLHSILLISDSIQTITSYAMKVNILNNS